MPRINRLIGQRISCGFIKGQLEALVDFGLQQTARPERRMARRE
jgi:hypothetical protein